MTGWIFAAAVTSPVWVQLLIELVRDFKRRLPWYKGKY